MVFQESFLSSYSFGIKNVKIKFFEEKSIFSAGFI